jgi:hypothetical protein
MGEGRGHCRNEEKTMPWTNRTQHAEALETNSVGFVSVKPDPMEYKTANGIVNQKKKVQLIEAYAKWVSETFVEAIARMVIQYPGDVIFNLLFLRPLDGMELREALDELADKSRTVFPDGEDEEAIPGMLIPYRFSLERWAAKDPESVSLGRVNPEDF